MLNETKTISERRNEELVFIDGNDYRNVFQIVTALDPGDIFLKVLSDSLRSDADPTIAYCEFKGYSVRICCVNGEGDSSTPLVVRTLRSYSGGRETADADPQTGR